jgi:hypothetical protein
MNINIFQWTIANKNKLIVGAICFIWSCSAFYLQQSTLGLFHDDGIYLVCAKSLATGHGYKIISLPGEPYQTKYPNLFPLLLSLGWLANPNFPENVPWFQGIIILFGFLFLVTTFFLFKDLFKFNEGIILLLFAIFASSPILLSASQWILAEIPFAACSLLSLWWFERKCAVPPNASIRSYLVLGILAAGLFLIKTQGIVLSSAIVILLISRRTWKPLIIFLLSSLPAQAYWVQWSNLHRNPSAPSLLNYYIGYGETLQWSSNLDQLKEFLGIAWKNLAYLQASVDHLIFPLVPLNSEGGCFSILTLLMAVGLIRLFKSISRLTALYMILYLGLLLILPWHPFRHLVPMASLILGCCFLGVDWMFAFLQSRLKPIALPLPFILLTGYFAFGIICITNVVFVLTGLQGRSNHLLPSYGNLSFSGETWKGFNETFEWIKIHTGKEEKIASVYDPLYYLQTNRQGIRFWNHNPKNYFYPGWDTASPQVGDPDSVLKSLKELGVTWLIREPVAKKYFKEGDAFDVLASKMISSSYPRSSLKFVSSDQHHWIYRLEW